MKRDRQRMGRTAGTSTRLGAEKDIGEKNRKWACILACGASNQAEPHFFLGDKAVYHAQRWQTGWAAVPRADLQCVGFATDFIYGQLFRLIVFILHFSVLYCIVFLFLFFSFLLAVAFAWMTEPGLSFISLKSFFETLLACASSMLRPVVVSLPMTASCHRKTFPSLACRILKQGTQYVVVGKGEESEGPPKIEAETRRRKALSSIYDALRRASQ